LATQEVWIPERQFAVVQRRRLHLQPRQDLVPDIGPFYKRVLPRECNFPKRDDQTERAQQCCKYRTTFDTQLLNGYVAHCMKPE
jgi:hypothetical protein